MRKFIRSLLCTLGFHEWRKAILYNIPGRRRYHEVCVHCEDFKHWR